MVSLETCSYDLKLIKHLHYNDSSFIESSSYNSYDNNLHYMSPSISPMSPSISPMSPMTPMTPLTPMSPLSPCISPSYLGYKLPVIFSTLQGLELTLTRMLDLKINTY